MATQYFQCDCCDYFSLPAYGEAEICPVCYWEEDWQVENGSAANHGLTLRQGRENFQRFGACSEEMLEYVLPPDRREQFQHAPRKLATVEKLIRQRLQVRQ